MDIPANMEVAIRDKHFWIHTVLLTVSMLTCATSNISKCTSFDLSVWYVLQYHDIGSFFAVELAIVILWILGEPLDRKLLICFDIAGILACLSVGILQVSKAKFIIIRIKLY